MLGFVQRRYDAQLDEVYAADPEVVVGDRQLLTGGRLYAQRFTCFGDEEAGVAIADARTGKLLREVPGRWTVESPRQETRIAPDNDDNCD